MSARGARARVASPAPRPNPTPARRPAPRVVTRPPRPRVKAGWWPVPIIALMLGGIVWINVSKLGLTTQTSAVVERAHEVEAEKVRLSTELSEQDAAVVERAKAELGMVDATAADITYLAAAKRTTLP